MKKNKKEVAASTPKTDFDITKYPKEDYTNSKGEEKTRYILPDEVFWEHLKEIPDGTINESRTRRAAKNGALKILGAEPEKDREIQKTGGETLQAMIQQRKTMREDFLIVLSQKAENGKTRQENIVISMADRAELGEVKAAQFIRDTIGEKPAETIDLSADITTEADRALMEKLKARMIEEQ